MSLALNPPLCTLSRTPRIALPLPDGNTPTHTLAIPAETHTTHADLVAAIATKSDLILSFLTATLHWRAHALLARAIAFHAPTLRTCGPQALGAVARFLEGGGAAAAVVEVPPPGLIALKMAINALSAARVVGTMAWIEDQEIAGRALKLEVGVLGTRQRWCAGCVRVFYVVVSILSSSSPFRVWAVLMAWCRAGSRARCWRP